MKPDFHGTARTVQRTDTSSGEQNGLTRSPLQRMLKLPGVKPDARGVDDHGVRAPQKARASPRRRAV